MDDLFEISSPIINTEDVFKASGHLERFNDYMIFDSKTNEFFRIDKYLECYFEK